jgi:hypothetical protein
MLGIITDEHKEEVDCESIDSVVCVDCVRGFVFDNKQQIKLKNHISYKKGDIFSMIIDIPNKKLQWLINGVSIWSASINEKMFTRNIFPVIQMNGKNSSVMIL